MADITFERVTMQSDNFSEVERIYEEAFPENEREMELAEIVRASENRDRVSLVAAIEEGKVIGMVVALENERYVFLFYLAVSKNLRGGGYGSKIMKAYIESCGDRTMLFEIETVIPGTENYEQRVKRQSFYERLGCVDSGYNFDYAGDNYSIFCLNQNEMLEDYIREHYRNIKKMAIEMQGSPEGEDVDEFVKLINLKG